MGVANALRWDDHHQASTLCTLWQAGLVMPSSWSGRNLHRGLVHPLDWIVTTLNGSALLHRRNVSANLGIFNVLGKPVDGKGPVVGELDSRMLPTVKRRSIHRSFIELDTKRAIFETGIKVVDGCAPYKRGGKIGLFGGAYQQHRKGWRESGSTSALILSLYRRHIECFLRHCSSSGALPGSVSPYLCYWLPRS